MSEIPSKRQGTHALEITRGYRNRDEIKILNRNEIVRWEIAG